MDSKLLAKIDLDIPSLHQEIDRILTIEANNEYSEFVNGAWSNCVLRNPTGDYRDAVMRVYNGAARDTSLATQLPYIMEAVNGIFRMEHLRWLRVFIFNGRGKLLPHKDFLEVDRAYSRLHLPLQTNPLCMHSEENEVFHMRQNELWYLNTSRVHSACNLSDQPRLSLVLDFEPNVPFSDLLKLPLIDFCETKPFIVNRPPFQNKDLQRILDCSEGLNEWNFVNLVWELAEVHYHKNVGCRDMFDWLISISERANDDELRSHCVAMRRFFIEQRSMREQFTLRKISQPSCTQQIEGHG